MKMKTEAFSLASMRKEAAEAQLAQAEQTKKDFFAGKLNVGNKITEMNAQLRDKKYVVLAAICARLQEAV
jgi:hypothetical protein